MSAWLLRRHVRLLLDPSRGPTSLPPPRASTEGVRPCGPPTRRRRWPRPDFWHRDGMTTTDLPGTRRLAQPARGRAGRGQRPSGDLPGGQRPLADDVVRLRHDDGSRTAPPMPDRIAVEVRSWSTCRAVRPGRGPGPRRANATGSRLASRSATARRRSGRSSTRGVSTGPWHRFPAGRLDRHRRASREGDALTVRAGARRLPMAAGPGRAGRPVLDLVWQGPSPARRRGVASRCGSPASPSARPTTRSTRAEGRSEVAGCRAPPHPGGSSGRGWSGRDQGGAPMNKAMLSLLSESEVLLARTPSRPRSPRSTRTRQVTCSAGAPRAQQYSTNYRRQSSQRVVAKGVARRGAGSSNKTAMKAEIFEDALARVSRRLAALARASAADLRAERLAAARRATPALLRRRARPGPRPRSPPHGRRRRSPRRRRCGPRRPRRGSPPHARRVRDGRLLATDADRLLSPTLAGGARARPFRVPRCPARRE